MTGPTEFSPLCGEGPTKLRRSESKGLLHTSEMLLTLLWLVWKAHRCKKKIFVWYWWLGNWWCLGINLLFWAEIWHRVDTKCFFKNDNYYEHPNYICLTLGSRVFKLSQAYFLSRSHLWSKSRFYKRACTEKCETEIKKKLFLGFMALRPGCLQKIKIFFVLLTPAGWACVVAVGRPCRCHLDWELELCAGRQ